VPVRDANELAHQRLVGAAARDDGQLDEVGFVCERPTDRLRLVRSRGLEAGLLDEIIVHVAPVLVGAGVRLFERSGPAVKLEPISSVDEGQTTVLRYSLGPDERT
jgi:hypothetical protein